MERISLNKIALPLYCYPDFRSKSSFYGEWSSMRVVSSALAFDLWSTIRWATLALWVLPSWIPPSCNKCLWWLLVPYLAWIGLLYLPHTGSLSLVELTPCMSNYETATTREPGVLRQKSQTMKGFRSNRLVPRPNLDWLVLLELLHARCHRLLYHALLYSTAKLHLWSNQADKGRAIQAIQAMKTNRVRKPQLAVFFYDQLFIIYKPYRESPKIVGVPVWYSGSWRYFLVQLHEGFLLLGFSSSNCA